MSAVALLQAACGGWAAASIPGLPFSPLTYFLPCEVVSSGDYIYIWLHLQLWRINHWLQQTSGLQLSGFQCSHWHLPIVHFQCLERTLEFVWSVFPQECAHSCLLYASAPCHVFQAVFVLCANLIFLPASLCPDLVPAKRSLINQEPRGCFIHLL